MLTVDRKFILIVLVGAGLALTGGCATKKFVSEGLSAQDAKIGDLESQVEANQRRLSETGEKLDSVEGEAQEAGRVGREAGQAAGQARTRADDAYELAQGKFVYGVVLTDTAGDFAIDSADLSDSAKQKLDALAARLKRENKSVYLEIVGHADSTGSEGYNLGLGLLRAGSVRRYLNMSHGIPLHRMGVISHGEGSPVADNDTREGRAQNRRVEIRVLS
jgi:outer membrane protein OmpA-like peptidoglycan-associated protein